MMRSVRSTCLSLVLFASVVGALTLSCTKPELVGADLLENEASQVRFTDTVSLKCSHELEDAVLTYSEENGRQLFRCLVGHLNDPYFGQADASIYSEIFLLSGSSAFLGTTIDSVVVSLRYDTVGLYGDLTQPVSLEMFLMEEEFDPENDILSNFAPAVSFESVAQKTFTPAPFDSIYIQSRGDTFRVPPMVRMQMSQQFIASLLQQDSATFESADSFRNWIKGVHVKANLVQNTMLAFDLRNFYSAMTVYYRKDTVSSEVSFGFTDALGAGIHHVRFAHDYAGSEAQKFLDTPSLGDSLLFIQGMAGLNMAISLPSLPNINDILINKAELEFYVADLPGDNLEWYPRNPQLVTAIENDEGNLDFTEDVSVSLSLFGGSLTGFGGSLMDSDTTGMSPQKYVMNVTASLQDIYKGSGDNEFFVIPFFKPNVPNRVVLYGPAHPTYPARLRLTYTIVQ